MTVIEDDLGALFQRFSPTDSRGIELHEFDDDVRANLIYEDFLYISRKRDSISSASWRK